MDSGPMTGQKRKRYEPPEQDLSVRIAGKIHHEKKEVHKAAKKAKVFETQKVVKRLKDLRKKTENLTEISPLESELSILKTIDPETISTSAFRSKILKDHTLKSHPLVLAALSQSFPSSGLSTASSSDQTHQKIQSRLLSSKILAVQVGKSVEGLKVLINPALKHPLVTEDQDEELVTEHGPSKAKKTKTEESKKVKDRKEQTLRPADEGDDEEDDDEDAGSEKEVVDDAGWESGTVNGGEDDDDDDGWESGSVTGPGLQRIHNASGSDSNEEDSSDDDSGSESESDLELQVHPSKSKTTKPSKDAKPKTKAKASGSESTFLPSLSVGFIKGSSSDSDVDEEGKMVDSQRKNRRGQRARRAIWEKKFGRNANHKKAEKEAEAAATAAAEARKAARSARTTKTGSNATAGKGGVDRGWGGRSHGGASNSHPTSASKPDLGPPITGPNSGVHTRSAPPKNEAEKPLHPSWEAKRKMKEKESGGIVPSLGKKITF